MTKRGEARQYFENVVLKYDGEDCLIWPYSMVKGRARMQIAGKSGNVATFVCLRIYGKAPENQPHTRHLCGKGFTGCVAKRHLKWGSPLENGSDKEFHRAGLTIPIQPLHL